MVVYFLLLKTFIAYFVLFQLKYANGEENCAAQDGNFFPEIYRMDDYQKCKKAQAIFCKVDVTLKTHNENSTVWKKIRKSKQEKFLYDYDQIHRIICIPRHLKFKDEGSSLEYVKAYVKEEVTRYDVQPIITKIKCTNSDFNKTITDDLLLCLIFLYFLLLAISTVYDVKLRRGSFPIKLPAIVHKILIALSIRSNYDKIFVKNTNEDYRKLKSIQGLRTISSILIILTHSKFSFISMSFLKDTKYVEEIFPNFLYVWIILDFYLIQVFLLISFWLLAVQILNIYKTNQKITFKDVILLIINRCMRFWPTMVFLLIIQTVFSKLIAKDSANPELFDTAISACSKYWFSTLLFTQNNLLAKDMCLPGTWYLSIDVQLYIVSSLIFYLIFYFKLNKRLLGILAAAFFLSHILFASKIYFYSLDVVFRPHPEFLKFYKFSKANVMKQLYFAFYVNWPTCNLGLCFGTIYYYINNNKVSYLDSHKKIFNIFWMLSFLFIPLLSIYVASHEFNVFWASIFGPLLKPLYAFGIGMGILGMSQNTGGIIKRIVECRLLEFLSQFTYSIYLFHFLVVFIRVDSTKPLEYSNTIFITSAIQDVIGGFMIGIFTHFTIELPGLNLQKLFVPHVKKINVTKKHIN